MLTVGGTVTIHGSNFGEDTSKTSVVVKGVGRLQVTSRSHRHDLVTFTMPAGQGAGLVAVVESADLRSGPAVFRYRAPTIARIEPTSLPTRGGSLIVHGTDLGPDPARIVVTVGGLIDCVPTNVAAGHASLECTLDAGTGSSLPVVLSSAGQPAQTPPAGLLFSFQPPLVTACSPTIIPTEGSFVECEGLNFGPNASAISVIIAGRSYPVDALVRPHDAIRLKVPEGTGANASVRILVGGLGDTTLVSYHSPEVDALSWTSPASTSGGAILEITGQNLGNDPSVVSVLVGSVSCDVTALVGHGRLFCKIGAGFGADLPLKLCVDSQCVEPGPKHSFSYDPPLVDTLALLEQQNSTAASTQGGFTLVLKGRNFGPLNGGSTSLMRIYVYSPPFAELPCGNLTMARAHSELRCTAPRGQGRGKLVRLETLASTASSSSRQHSFLSTTGFSCKKYRRGNGRDLERALILTARKHTDAPPRLSPSQTLQLQLGPTSGGGSVVIRGQNFGSTSSLVSISIGSGGSCANVGIRNDSHLFCTAEPGQGHSHLVRVTVSGQSTGKDNTALLLACYDAPEILSVQPRSAGPGQTLVLTGLLLIEKMSHWLLDGQPRLVIRTRLSQPLFRHTTGLNFGSPSRQHEAIVRLGAGETAVTCGNVRVVEPHHRIECTLPQNMTRQLGLGVDLTVSGLAAVGGGDGGDGRGGTLSMLVSCWIGLCPLAFTAYQLMIIQAPTRLCQLSPAAARGSICSRTTRSAGHVPLLCKTLPAGLRLWRLARADLGILALLAVTNATNVLLSSPSAAAPRS